MEIKILGTGCAKCKKLYEEAEKAIAETGVQADLSKVEKLDDIIQYGVAVTPALVIDGEVKSAGKIAKTREIASWIAAVRDKE